MNKAALVVVLLSTSLAHAGDSSWLICKGIGTQGAKGSETKTHLVASLHEARGTDGASRDLAVTLIYGRHVSRGEILGKSLGKDADVVGKVAPLKLASEKAKNVFTGTGELAQDMKTFTLKGTIDPTYAQDPKAKQVPITAKLTCELLDDLAIKP